jgi:SNF2 family DNA or RNA helicase
MPSAADMRIELYPFQREGVEFLRAQERAMYARWDTGTGKTVLAESAILLKREEGFDLTLYVVRPNHLEGARRKLRDHTGIEGHLLTGDKTRRTRTFLAADDAVVEGDQPVLIFNPEKFATDTEMFAELIEGRSVLLILDEAQKRYGNRLTKLYRATCEALYRSKTDRGIHYPRAGYERASRMFGLALSATPITKSPENLFNTVRLLYPGFLGSVNDFNNRYAGPRNQWGEVIYWRNLDRLAEAVAPIVHQVSKEDPEVKAQFPAVMEETVFCDMDAPTERLYRTLQREYSNVGALSMLDFDEILAAIGCLQMIVSNPRAVLHSAKEREAYEEELEAFAERMEDDGVGVRDKARALREFEKRYRRGSEVALKLRELVGNDAAFTDHDKKGEATNGKLVALREFLEEHDGKAVVFCTEVVIQGLIAEWLAEWGIPYVHYNGAMSAKNRQDAIDAFRTREDIRVFLSTDAGQDSIDLPEASLTIHYDWPWSWAEVQQRQNRQHRIDSEQESVRVVTLAVPATVEDRKAEIVAKKRGYHQAIFEGATAEPDDMTQDDYLYVLTGVSGGPEI